ncbi:hypothetical protein QBC38DRAFT_518079 [Podospora fimiseda]|uniref:Nephrocystin 3-like N-terminal domain-containing protein n=1 Tax=Podospora fimiseda TaxID=252190 RepID=A0AAN7BEL2_9PEZI|nr:hypothetical protein QBC38DRAFT_518079 [Podospora fimiseda]
MTSDLHRLVKPFWRLAQRGDRLTNLVTSGLYLLYPDAETLGELDDIPVRADLIFVAGLGGHYQKTWQADDGTIWPRDLLQLERYELQNLRVWSFHYNSTLRGSSSQRKIGDHARELLAEMMMKIRRGSWILEPQQERANAVQLKPIIFVGHSLGGMLIKKTMLIAQTDPNYNMFFAVPHQGLDKRDWERFVKQVLIANAPYPGVHPTSKMLKEATVDNIPGLLDIAKDFSDLQARLSFVNYTEGEVMEGWDGPLVAEGRGWMDAADKIEHKIDDNHFGICKFEQPDPREQKTGPFEIVVGHLQYLIDRTNALKYIGDEAKEALESLCPLGFHGYFMSKRATVGTGDWIADRPQFQEWIQNSKQADENKKADNKQSRLLWIQGPQASGKSYLARHIITDLIPQSTTQKVAHCFLDDSVPGRGRQEHLLRATLHHALRVEPELIQEHLVPPYLKGKNRTNPKPGVATPVGDDEIWTLQIVRPIWPEVLTKVTSRGVLTLVVDGFSEMSPECQRGFFDCLAQVKDKAESQEHRDNLRILLLSRDDIETGQELEGWGGFHIYKIKPEDIQADIEKTIRATVENPEIWEGRDPTLPRPTEEDIQEIQKTIVSSSDGNWGVAIGKAEMASESLLVDAPETTIALVKELPNDIAGIYDEKLKRIQQDTTHLPFVKQLLQWAAFQKEPLKEEELNTAIALGMAREKALDGISSEEELGSLEKWIGNTRSLAEKHAHSLVEFREGVLQPLDKGLKDHLVKAGMEEGPAHAALASNCINYLTMEYFAGSHKPIADSVEEKVKKIIEDHSFSRYAALYWKSHVDSAGDTWQGIHERVVEAREVLEDDKTEYGICYSELQWYLTNGSMEGYPSRSKGEDATETSPTISTGNQVKAPAEQEAPAVESGRPESVRLVSGQLPDIIDPLQQALFEGDVDSSYCERDECPTGTGQIGRESMASGTESDYDLSEEGEEVDDTEALREVERQRELREQEMREQEAERERQVERQNAQQKEIKRQEIRQQQDFEQQQEVEQPREVERQQKLKRPQELEEIERQEEAKQQQETERQKEPKQKHRAERQPEIERQQDIEKQQELEEQQKIERQQKMKKRRELERQDFERQPEIKKPKVQRQQDTEQPKDIARPQEILKRQQEIERQRNEDFLKEKELRRQEKEQQELVRKREIRRQQKTEDLRQLEPKRQESLPRQQKLIKTRPPVDLIDYRDSQEGSRSNGKTTVAPAQHPKRSGEYGYYPPHASVSRAAVPIRSPSTCTSSQYSGRDGQQEYSESRKGSAARPGWDDEDDDEDEEGQSGGGDSASVMGGATKKKGLLRRAFHKAKKRGKFLVVDLVLVVPELGNEYADVLMQSRKRLNDWDFEEEINCDKVVGSPMLAVSFLSDSPVVLFRLLWQGGVQHPQFLFFSRLWEGRQAQFG